MVGACQAAGLRSEGSGVLGEMKIKVISAELPTLEFHAIPEREFPGTLIRSTRDRFRARTAQIFRAKDFADAKFEASPRQVATVVARVEIAVEQTLVTAAAYRRCPYRGELELHPVKRVWNAAMLAVAQLSGLR